MLNNKYLIINILFNASALDIGLKLPLHWSDTISSLQWGDLLT